MKRLSIIIIVFIQFVFTENLMAINGDVDGNGKLGLEDCISILQTLSGAKIIDGGTIKCGDSLSGIIGETDEIDEFSFNAWAGERIAIAVTDLSTSALFRPQWALYDPSGNRIGDYEYEGNYGRTLTTDGIFTIKIWDNENDGTGKYGIRLEPVSAYFNGVLNCAQNIECGDTINNALESKNAADSYRFSGKAGEVVAVAVTNLSNSALFRPQWALYDPSGTRIGDYEYEGNYARTLTTDGFFTIRLWDKNIDGAGEYSVRLEPFSGNFNGAPNCAQLVEYGATVAGELESEKSADSYRFSGKAGEVVAINVANLSTSALFRPQWALYDPSGTRIGDYEYEGNYARTLTTNGFFTIRLWDNNNDGIGEYEMSLNLNQ